MNNKRYIWEEDIKLKIFYILIGIVYPIKLLISANENSAYYIMYMVGVIGTIYLINVGYNELIKIERLNVISRINPGLKYIKNNDNYEDENGKIIYKSDEKKYKIFGILAILISSIILNIAIDILSNIY